MKKIELLAPAKNLSSGKLAINCGADAVYIGAQQFGAREAAGNPVADIEALINYAHRYWSRVFVTINTLLYDSELPAAVKLIHTLHQAGVDGIIIQDVGLLMCDLPPVPIIASTQMHNHSPARVKFLEEIGFSRVILARELSLQQIKEIRTASQIELECFVHGALCVGYSGQCYLSHALGGRSGNRGQCAQPCRKVYHLFSADGSKDFGKAHWLSIRDLNLSADLAQLLDAGITSFKIEGRLKDETYLINVVSAYRKILDDLLEHSDGMQKAASGSVLFDGFSPDLNKTFNRGYSQYFLHGRKEKIGAHDTPTHRGEFLGCVKQTGNGWFELDRPVDIHRLDGISFFAIQGELAGTLINKFENGKIYPARMHGILSGLQIYRNHDENFITRLTKANIQRKIAITFRLMETVDGVLLSVTDEDGVFVCVAFALEKIKADDPARASQTLMTQLQKTGGTDFICADIQIETDSYLFFPISRINTMRRAAIDALIAQREKQRPPLPVYAIQNNNMPYPEPRMGFEANALNSLAKSFYQQHQVVLTAPAAERGLTMHGRKVMTTRYCIRYECGICPKYQHHDQQMTPDDLIMKNDEGDEFILKFNCTQCQMAVFLK